MYVPCADPESFARGPRSNFTTVVGKSNFSDKFKNIIKRYKRVGYNMDIM